MSDCHQEENVSIGRRNLAVVSCFDLEKCMFPKQSGQEDEKKQESGSVLLSRDDDLINRMRGTGALKTALCMSLSQPKRLKNAGQMSCIQWEETRLGYRKRRKAKPVVRPTPADGFPCSLNHEPQEKKMRETKRKCFSRCRNSSVVSSANSPSLFSNSCCFCCPLCPLIYVRSKFSQPEREKKEAGHETEKKSVLPCPIRPSYRHPS